MTVFRDPKTGDWVATRQFTYPSGATGYERRVVIPAKGYNCFELQDLRDEAERLAAEWKEST